MSIFRKKIVEDLTENSLCTRTKQAVQKSICANCIRNINQELSVILEWSIVSTIKTLNLCCSLNSLHKPKLRTWTGMEYFYLEKTEESEGSYPKTERGSFAATIFSEYFSSLQGLLHAATRCNHSTDNGSGWWTSQWRSFLQVFNNESNTLTKLKKNSRSPTWGSMSNCKFNRTRNYYNFKEPGISCLHLTWYHSIRGHLIIYFSLIPASQYTPSQTTR